MNRNDSRITANPVPEANRADFAHRLFGLQYPTRLEPTVFSMAGDLAAAYDGGMWVFYALSNGGFFMAPDQEAFDVVSENGFSGRMSGLALGVTACMYAYSHLSFGRGAFAEKCADHYHLLRDFALGHPEGSAILAACD